MWTAKLMPSNCSGEELNLELHAGEHNRQLTAFSSEVSSARADFSFYIIFNYCGLSTVSDTEMRSRAFNSKQVDSDFLNFAAVRSYVYNASVVRTGSESELSLKGHLCTLALVEVLPLAATCNHPPQ
jgi:hypothetical protein